MTSGGERRGSVHPPLGRPTPASNDDFFDEDELRTLREYVAPLRRTRRIKAVVDLAVGVWLIFGLDLGPRAASWVADQGWFVRLLVVAATFEVVGTAVKVPFDAWVDLVYEKRAGHSTMTGGTFVKDLVLGFALSVVLTAVLFGPLYAAIHAFDWWWLIGGIGVVAVLALFQFVAPVLIMPRFNKFTPLEPGPIRDRIEELAEQSNVEIQGVYLMDASKRTNRANAGVTGFGKTKRVIINDTICEYPLDLLSQVIAHELGHYRLRHTIKSFPLLAVALPLTFAFVQLVARSDSVLGWAGVGDIGDPASFGLLGLATSIPFTLANVASSWQSRKHEREADLEALKLLADPTSFVAVWPKLVLTDKANLEPTWWERLNSSHPEVRERMQFGLDWARMNDVAVTPPPRRAITEPVPEPVPEPAT